MQSRVYLTITQDDIDAKLAEQLRSRELELLAYDFERSTHERAIADLGDLAWDEKTSPYRGLPRDAMIARAQNAGLDAEAILKISDLQALEAHKLNLSAVMVETAKSERHHATILDALPAGARRDAALTKKMVDEKATIAVA